MLYHDPSDPPRLCWACVDDAVNAPDEPMPEHDPEIAGTDPETGPYCVCGHGLEDVAPTRTDRIALTIRHDQTEPPGPSTVDQMARLLESVLSAAGIAATVTAAILPEYLCACGHAQSLHTGGGRSDGGLCYPTGTTRDACDCPHFRTVEL